jgi:WD40 repeat protein
LTTAAFRPGDSREIAVSARNEVCLYSYVSEGPGSSCIPVDQEPSALAFSPDGAKLALVDRAGVVRVVDIASRAQLARFVTEESPDSILWSGSGALVAVRTPKAIAQVWHVEREREVARLTDVKQLLWFEPSGALAVLSESGLLRRWNLREGALEQRSLSHPTNVHDLAFSPDGKSLVTGSGYSGEESTRAPDYNVRIWSLDQPGDPVVAPQGQAVGMVRVLPDSRHVIVAGWYRVSVWDRQQGKEIASLPCPSDFDDIQLTGLSLAWSANGRLLACHTSSNTIQVYRLPDGQAVGKPLTGEDGVLGLAFDDEGQYLAMGRGKTIEIWDAGSSDISARIPVDVEEFYLQFIPRSRRLLLVGESGARVLDLAKGAFEGEKFGPRKFSARPAFSPDAKSIALIAENTVTLWELATGREIATFPHPEQVFNVAFSADGAFLATTSRDGAARIWDVATRRERVRLSGFLARSSNLYQIAFSPDGRLLATQDSDVRLWKWHFDDLRAEACRLVRRNLTEAEWVEYVGTADIYAATCPTLAEGKGGSSPPAKSGNGAS